MMVNRVWWGTDPYASLRSSHDRTKGLFLLLESWSTDDIRWLCSRQPSIGRNPFCDGDMMPSSIAQAEILLAITAAYTLYKVFCSAIGLQLSRTNGSSPL